MSFTNNFQRSFQFISREVGKKNYTIYGTLNGFPAQVSITNSYIFKRNNLYYVEGEQFANNGLVQKVEGFLGDTYIKDKN